MHASVCLASQGAAWPRGFRGLASPRQSRVMYNLVWLLNRPPTLCVLIPVQRCYLSLLAYKLPHIFPTNAAYCHPFANIIHYRSIGTIYRQRLLGNLTIRSLTNMPRLIFSSDVTQIIYSLTYLFQTRKTNNMGDAEKAQTKVWAQTVWLCRVGREQTVRSTTGIYNTMHYCYYSRRWFGLVVSRWHQST